MSLPNRGCGMSICVSNGLLEGAAEKIAAITGVELGFKIESLDILSLEEMLRMSANPCNMTKITLGSGRMLLLVRR